MRKITFESVNAFYNRVEFNKSNMSVVTNNGQTILKLHNNVIAMLSPDNRLKITNAGWQSNTTKERLNALKGVSIVQKNFVWYLNGKAWDGSWIEIS